MQFVLSQNRRKGDGQDHKVSGSPYYDTTSVRAVDDHTVEIVNKKRRKGR